MTGGGLRGWSAVPAVVLILADAGLTLTSQPAGYWAGDRAAADEVNPLARPLLERGPWPFGAAAVGWAGLVAAVVTRWRHPAAGWLAVGVAAAHAVGGASWLVRMGPWGLPLAVAYLAAAARLAAGCWRSVPTRVDAVPFGQPVRPPLQPPAEDEHPHPGREQ